MPPMEPDTPLQMQVDGKTFGLDRVDPHLPLLHFLRDRGLTGVKEGCAEGECGACAVVLVSRAPEPGESRYVPVNSCLLPAVALAGREVITVHGIAPSPPGGFGTSHAALHPVQDAMVATGGSQCGYCTPGFVVSMFAEYYRPDRVPGEVNAEAIGGNLCRCTGYRPIRDALASLGAAHDDHHKKRLALATEPVSSVSTTSDGATFHRPADLPALLALLQAHPDAKLLAGGTDVYVEINQLDRRWTTLIALEAIEALQTIDDRDDSLVIGAGVPLSVIEDTLGDKLPILGELLPLFSSRLIRNRATLGGNLANASPIGDSPPALLALDARVVLSSVEGDREIPLTDFFVDYRKTALTAAEIVRAIVIPKPFPSVQRFYKVSKRVMDDISTVAAGFGLWVEDGRVRKARLAFGGVAATPARASDAEDALVGHPFDAMAVVKASTLLSTAFTPMADHRGSADYRAAMVPRLLEKLLADLEVSEAAP